MRVFLFLIGVALVGIGIGFGNHDLVATVGKPTTAVFYAAATLRDSLAASPGITSITAFAQLAGL